MPTKHEVVRQRNDLNDSSDASDNEVQWESEVTLESAGQGNNVRPPNVVEAWDDTGGDDFGTAEDTAVVDNSDFLRCHFPGCNDVANFDLNIGQYTSLYCYNHLSTTPVANGVSNVPSLLPQPDMMATNPGQ